MIEDREKIKAEIMEILAGLEAATDVVDRVRKLLDELEEEAFDSGTDVGRGW
jgi:hypothetical protein